MCITCEMILFMFFLKTRSSMTIMAISMNVGDPYIVESNSSHECMHTPNNVECLDL